MPADESTPFPGRVSALPVEDQRHTGFNHTPYVVRLDVYENEAGAQRNRMRSDGPPAGDGWELVGERSGFAAAVRDKRRPRSESGPWLVFATEAEALRWGAQHFTCDCDDCWSCEMRKYLSAKAGAAEAV